MKKILIVDEQEILRDGVKQVLDKPSGTVSFGEASTVQEALRLVRGQDWDIVVMALSLGDRSGLDLLKELKQVRPHLPVLILSRHSEEQFARRALAAGALGYVMKNSPRADLVKAVKKVMSGERYLSATIAEKLIFKSEFSMAGQPHESLSDREFEVFRLISSGKTVRETATILSLSNSTISTHRTRILKKMGMQTNADLTRYAFQNKLVD